MQYNSFKYLFPPRPEVKIPPYKLDSFDTGQYIAQVKYNGSAAVVFTNGKETHIFNRHREQLSNVSKAIEFSKLARTDNWFVYAGEYLNKGKLGETGIKEKDKFVIWDVLVWDGEYLTGHSLLKRLELLEQIYPCQRARVQGKRVEIYEHLCCTEFTGIYKAPTYQNGFLALYNDLIKTDLYEGLVLKKIASRLTYGLQSVNNHEWQIKCRKENKLYKF
jgi:ATP-dependent DNA ligase